MSAKLAACVALILCATAALVVAGGVGYNPSYYPGLVSGFSNNFYSYKPSAGFNNCRYWCRSKFTRQYYCCTNLNSAGFYGGGVGGPGFNNFGGGVGGPGFNNFGGGVGGGFGGGYNGGYGGGGKVW